MELCRHAFLLPGPEMQFQFDISRSVSKIPTHKGTNFFCCPCNGLNIENLTGVVIHPTNQHQGAFVPYLSDLRQDVLHSEIMLPFPLLQLHNGFLWIESVEPYLTRQQVLVTREGFFLTDDPEPFPGGPVKRNHQQMQVYREGVHYRDLRRFCANHGSQLLCKPFVIIPPGFFGIKMSLYRQFGPVVHYLIHVLLCIDGLKPQGISCKIDGFLPVDPGEDESVAIILQWVLGIKAAGKLAGILKLDILFFAAKIQLL